MIENLKPYHPKYILEVVVSGDILDEHKVIHILETFRHEYTDDWIMSRCMNNLESYILREMDMDMDRDHNATLYILKKYKKDRAEKFLELEP